MQDNTDESAAQASARSSRWRWRRRLIAGLAALLVCVAGIVVFVAVRGPAEAGDEVDEHGGAYGYHASMAVGHTFTDGFSRIRISSNAREPLRLISARPVEESGDTLRVIGTLARIVPDMLPAGYEDGWFQVLPGFPPAERDARGAVPVNGLTVRVSRPDDEVEVELQIGYEVVAPGRYTRYGVELIYEYEGRQHKAIIPSRLAICSPANIACTPNDE